MRRSLARVSVVLIAAAPLAITAPPSSAEAISGVVLEFRASTFTSAEFFFPGLGPSAEGASYSLSTNGAGDHCTAYAASTGVPIGTCDVDASGTINSGPGGLGAFCGHMTGSGTATIRVGAVWDSGSFTIHPGAGFTHPITYDGTTDAAGSAQFMPAAPGHCGIGGPTTAWVVDGTLAFGANAT